MYRYIVLYVYNIWCFILKFVGFKSHSSHQKRDTAKKAGSLFFHRFLYVRAGFAYEAEKCKIIVKIRTLDERLPIFRAKISMILFDFSQNFLN